MRPTMGLFDLPAPLFSFADGFLGVFLPRWASLAVWGLLAGATSMTLYRLLSPQERIERIKSEAGAARNAMLAYDGDFDGMLPLMRRSLTLSVRHLAYALGPAIAASLPALFLITYLSNAYGYVQPVAGTSVAVRVEPIGAAVDWTPATRPDGAVGVWRIRWPAAGRTVRLSGAQGLVLATFPLAEPVPVLGRFAWWNLLFGNPAGYLPAGTKVSSIAIDLPAQEFLSFGPGWMRGWEAIFFLSAAMSSIFIKLVFKVH